MRRYWSAVIVLLSFVASTGARIANGDEGRACTGSLHTNLFYSLVEVGESTTTNDYYPGDDTNDSVHVIGKQTQIGTITMVGASGYCGYYTSAPDASYPTSGTYNESFVVHLSSTNVKGARFPRNVFYRNYQPNPGTKFSALTRTSTGTCRLDDSEAIPHYFYKVCVSQ